MPTPSHFFSRQIADARYYSPSRPDRRAPLTVMSAGWESCRSDYCIRRHTFPWLALELVVKGEGWLTVSKGRFRIRPGTLFCYGPGIDYEMVSDPALPLQKYFVDFAGPEARRSLAASPIHPGQVRQALEPHELQELFERMLLEGNRQARLSSAIAVNYLRLLFQKIDQCADSNPSQGTSRALASYLRGKAFLDENYPHVASIEEAATRLGMTSETLCRHFRRFSRISPHQYLTHLRVHAAVNLLLGSDLLVKEVGSEVGLSDPFHFSRLFKRIQGLSPEAFRRLRQRTVSSTS